MADPEEGTKSLSFLNGSSRERRDDAISYETKNMLRPPRVKSMKKKMQSQPNHAFKDMKQTLFKLAREKNHDNSQPTALRKFESELKETPERDKLLKATDNRGNTAMHYAAKAGNLEVCKLLYSKGLGVNINVRGQNKMTPLQFAARYGDADRATDVWSCMKWIMEVYAEKGKGGTSMKMNETELFDLKEKDKYNFSLLHHAIQNTNTEEKPFVASELLKLEQFSIKDTDKQGNTSLHLAAQFDREEEDRVLDIFIEATKDGSVSKEDFLYCIEEKNRLGQTPIHIACAVGNSDSVRQLVESAKRCGCEIQKIINTPDNDDSYPLHLAIENGNLEMIDILMAEGAQSSEKAITCAARTGNVATIEKLRKTKSTPEPMSKDTVDGKGSGSTALFTAAQHNNIEMVKYLMKEGDQNTSNSDGVSPLMAALKGGHIKIAELLLKKKKAKHVLKEKDNEDKNVFHYACNSRKAEEGIQALVKFFFKTDPKEVEKLLTDKDLNEETPCHVLAHQQLEKDKFEKIFKNLEESKIDVPRCMSEKNASKENPLHQTAKCDHPSFLDAILNQERDSKDEIYHLLTAKDENSNSVLHLATQHKQTDTARLIIDYLSQNSMETVKYLSMKNYFGWTPFSGAVASGDFELVREMLRGLSKDERRTIVNQPDFSNASPLYLAAKYGHVEVFDLLMVNMADITRKGSDDKTALDIAIDREQRGIISVIISGARWKEAFQMTSTTEKGALDTPLRKLIRQFPQLAEELLDKCYSIDILSQEEARERNISQEIVNINVDFIEDTYKFIKVKSKTDDAIIFYHKDMAGVIDGGKDHEVSISNHPMMIMADERKLDLLQHPLCLAIILRKWRLYGRRFYYFQLAYYLLFLAAVTTYVLTSPSPVQYPGLFNCTAFFHDYPPPNITSPLIAENSGWNDISRISVIVLFCIRVLLYFGNQEFRIRSIQMISKPNDFEWSKIGEMGVFIFDAIVYILSLYIASHNFSNFTFEDFSITVAVRSCVQWQFSAITITFAWLNLLTYMRLLYGIGKYIILIQDVLTTFISVILVFAIQLIAFAFGFHILLSNNDNFSTPHDALLKTMIMWSGEFDYTDIFFKDLPPLGFGEEWDIGHQSVPFPGLTYILFVYFFLGLSLVALNVLVGLTVDDIRNFLENADLRKLKMILKYILQIERTSVQKRSTKGKKQVVHEKPITRRSHFEIAVTNDLISKQKIWEKIEKKLENGRKKAMAEKEKKDLKDFIERHLKKNKVLRSKAPAKTKMFTSKEGENRPSFVDFSASSSLEEYGDEEFHDLVEDVKSIKDIVEIIQANNDVEGMKGVVASIQSEMKDNKKVLDNIQSENNSLREEVRELVSQLKDRMKDTDISKSTASTNDPRTIII